ncbi:MAG TPA: alpha/beta fold hydrolase [Nitrospiria bacterium]
MRLPHPHSPADYLDYSLTLAPGGRASERLAVFIHGFGSDQKGDKARFFRERFNAAGCDFLAFDHRGHGASSGTMTELTVTRNLEDAEAILLSVGEGYRTRILIGSSMGGQTAAWLAARRPKDIAANLLIAPAFRFFQNPEKDFGPREVASLRKTGVARLRNDWLDVKIGRALLTDARRYKPAELAPAYRTPTLILHGIEDASVPYEDSVGFVRRCKARPLELILIAGGDHRLTDRKDMLFEEMAGFCRRIGAMR